MRGNSVIRPFLLRRPPPLRSISSAASASNHHLNKTPQQNSPLIPWTSPPTSVPPSISTANSLFSSPSLHFPRTLCSSPSSGPANIVLIKSDKEYDGTIKTIQDKSLPAIFYFTAAWCGPCRFISPVISQLSEKYPHVTTYKLDIDEKDLGTTLAKLGITAVSHCESFRHAMKVVACHKPTLHFFKDGEKVDHIVGADLARLENNMEKFYG